MSKKDNLLNREKVFPSKKLTLLLLLFFFQKVLKKYF